MSQQLLDTGPDALFSSCRKYRYTLWRWWDRSKGYVQFIGLNPSTADEVRDDPTIRRCIGFARDWGYGGLCMTNLFAFRATKPRAMMGCPYPQGTQNDGHLVEVARDADLVVAAWGNRGAFLARDEEVRDTMPCALHCLGLTKDGQPKHPLYLSKDTQPVFWDMSTECEGGAT